MPRTKEQFNHMKQERVESLLESSLLLFALYGNSFTVDQIAEMSHCSHGIIYHYFKNTSEITAKLLNSRSFCEFKSNLVKPYKNVIAKEAIYDIVEVLISLKNKKDFCYGKILIAENGKGTLKSVLCDLVERGQREGDITGGEPNDIVNCFFYLIDGFYTSKLIGKQSDRGKPSFDNVIELFRKKR